MAARVSPKPSILYCGSHRVNFVMFDPIYQRLRHRGDIWLGVSSGRYRRKLGLVWFNPKDPDMLNERVLAEFDIAPDHVVKTSFHDEREYDVYVSSNRSGRTKPPNSKVSVQIFHGVSFRNFSVNSAYLAFDKLFFPGRYHLEKYLEAGILEEGDPRIELIGMPKVDRVVDGSIKRDEVLRSLNLDPSRLTILWCPTGANDNSLDVLGDAGLKAAQQAGHNLIIKLHDHPHLKGGRTLRGLQDQLRAQLGEHGHLATSSDVTPLLVAADLLISDASSVAYEYCLRDRPIIFVDVPKLLAYRATLPECAMDLETHGQKVGRVVKSAGELADAIDQELAEPQRLSKERTAAAQHIFHDPGKASDRVANRLLELAGAAVQ